MTTDKTPETRLHVLSEKATAGPWHVDEGLGGVWVVTGGKQDVAVHPSGLYRFAVLGTGSYPDADYIAAARNLAEPMAAVVAAARAVNDPMVRDAGGERWWDAHDDLANALRQLDEVGTDD